MKCSNSFTGCHVPSIQAATSHMHAWLAVVVQRQCKPDISMEDLYDYFRAYSLLLASPTIINYIGGGTIFKQEDGERTIEMFCDHK